MEEIGKVKQTDAEGSNAVPAVREAERESMLRTSTEEILGEELTEQATFELTEELDDEEVPMAAQPGVSGSILVILVTAVVAAAVMVMTTPAVALIRRSFLESHK